ncbi:MAG TPA: head GIN domain-containing protein [Pedobacter sp.]|nr:head GIN domain-containing protein [Pedobacter sp.]
MKRIIPILFTAAICAANLTTIAGPVTAGKSINYKNDERKVKNFSGVVAGGPIEVIITMGSTENLRFEGDAEAIATLVSEVKGEVLIIRPAVSWKSWARKYEGKKITAYVNAKTITSLSMSGDGSITLKGVARATELAITLSGSGRVKTAIDADLLTSTLSGSGSLEISGKADKASVNISGSGSISGKTLAITDLTSRISGSGSISAKVSGNIKALISGSGHVYYTGNPSIEQKVLGSGGVSEL